MSDFEIQAEYASCRRVLEQTGMVTPLPRSQRLGVIGFDGGEYPIPELADVQAMLTKNAILAERKAGQGFTRLQLTPMAMSIRDFYDKVGLAVIKHQRSGRMIESFAHPVIPDRVIPAISEIHPFSGLEVFQNPFPKGGIGDMTQTGELVYFPASFPSSVSDFKSSPHQGASKADVVRTPQVCAVPGWSIGFVEEIPSQSHDAMLQTIGGRKRLERGLYPQQYLDILKTPLYAGETGWTVEDFLTNFLNRLVLTDRVDAYLATWLIGNLIVKNEDVIGDGVRGFWSQIDSSVRLGTRDLEWRHPSFTARTIVRLVG